MRASPLSYLTKSVIIFFHLGEIIGKAGGEGEEEEGELGGRYDQPRSG